MGVKVQTIPEEQTMISDMIEEVKQGSTGSKLTEQLRNIALKLIDQGAEAIIIGCTELSLLLHDGDLAVPIFDCNEVLAKVCVKKAQGENG